VTDTNSSSGAAPATDTPLAAVAEVAPDATPAVDATLEASPTAPDSPPDDELAAEDIGAILGAAFSGAAVGAENIYADAPASAQSIDYVARLESLAAIRQPAPSAEAPAPRARIHLAWNRDSGGRYTT